MEEVLFLSIQFVCRYIGLQGQPIHTSFFKEQLSHVDDHGFIRSLVVFHETAIGLQGLKVGSPVRKIAPGNQCLNRGVVALGFPEGEQQALELFGVSVFVFETLQPCFGHRMVFRSHFQVGHNGVPGFRVDVRLCQVETGHVPGQLLRTPFFVERRYEEAVKYGNSFAEQFFSLGCFAGPLPDGGFVDKALNQIQPRPVEQPADGIEHRHKNRGRQSKCPFESQWHLKRL